MTLRCWLARLQELQVAGMRIEDLQDLAFVYPPQRLFGLGVWIGKGAWGAADVVEILPATAVRWCGRPLGEALEGADHLAVSSTAPATAGAWVSTLIVGVSGEDKCRGGKKRRL